MKHVALSDESVTEIEVRLQNLEEEKKIINNKTKILDASKKHRRRKKKKTKAQFAQTTKHDVVTHSALRIQNTKNIALDWYINGVWNQ